jgi:hypothetical protein
MYLGLRTGDEAHVWSANSALSFSREAKGMMSTEGLRCPIVFLRLDNHKRTSASLGLPARKAWLIRRETLIWGTLYCNEKGVAAAEIKQNPPASREQVVPFLERGSYFISRRRCRARL